MKAVWTSTDVLSLTIKLLAENLLQLPSKPNYMCGSCSSTRIRIVNWRNWQATLRLFGTSQLSSMSRALLGGLVIISTFFNYSTKTLSRNLWGGLPEGQGHLSHQLAQVLCVRSQARRQGWTSAHQQDCGRHATLPIPDLGQVKVDRKRRNSKGLIRLLLTGKAASPCKFELFNQPIW